MQIIARRENQNTNSQFQHENKQLTGDRTFHEGIALKYAMKDLIN